ncbi:MAG: sulfatase-like hydrolase/transferase [Bacteroidota bacterium]
MEQASKTSKFRISNQLFIGLLFFLGSFFLTLCNSTSQPEPPNVILIMADDMGYETLSCYGGTSYHTPNLDRLAANGVVFNNSISQPLCTPSRVKIMTGQYNYRNYNYFGHLGLEAKTFGHLMQDHGYVTCISGKWQLNGLAYKKQIEDWSDQTRPQQLGFQEYCLWQLTKERKEGERFANALIEQNGEVLPRNEDIYGPDVFSQFVLDFIEKNQDQPFFVYYPMVLVHDPFVPTPDSEEWSDPSKRYEADTAYFKDMMAYTDKIVGNIANKLEELDLADNTILIFTGDNGTHPTIYSYTKNGIVRGGKGNTTDAGTHVPLIVNWGKQIKQPFQYDGLVSFNDFYATFADLLNVDIETDGQSFLPVLKEQTIDPYREHLFVHYDPKWGKNVNKFRNQFVRTQDYKLYQDGKFYNLQEDVLEQHDLSAQGTLSAQEEKIKKALKAELERHPAFQ